jgi:hypothetical protein
MKHNTQVAVAQHVWLIAIHVDGAYLLAHFGQNKANSQPDPSVEIEYGVGWGADMWQNRDV